MTLATVATLVDAIRQYHLLEPAQLDQLAAWQTGVADPHALAKRLLEKDWLTPFQVNHLLQGRAHNLLLGPYIILERLGEGGTGQVYKARHQRMRRVAALKVIRRELLAETEVVARFYREIQVASQVAHPNVVHAYDAGPNGETHFLAMEYVKGIDLHRLVKQNGWLPVDQACDYVRQAARGLQHIHEHGLVHRDVKPSNLLLTEVNPPGSGQAVVKLLDLGLARFERPLQGELTGSFTPVGGVMMGTPDYMAPEQALDMHQADIRSDIYSLGCTLYYLLTAQPPFPGGTLAQKLLWHQQVKPPPVTSLRPEMPAGVQTVLERMLAKSPAERHLTPIAVVHDLEAAVNGRGLPLAASASPGADEAAPAALPVSEADALAELDDIPAAIEPTAPALPSGLTRALLAQMSSPEEEGTAILPTEPVATAIVADRPASPSPLMPLMPPTEIDRPPVKRTLWPRLAGLAVGSAVLLGGAVLLWGLFGGGGSATRRDTVAEIRPTVSRQTLPKLTQRPIPADEAFDWQPKELVAVLGEHRLRHWGVVQNVGFNARGANAFSYGTDHVLRVWNVANGREVNAFTERKGLGAPKTLSPDGKTLAYTGADFAVQFLDMRTGKDGTACIGHKNRVQLLNFSRDSKTLGSASQDGSIRLWSAGTGKERALLPKDPQAAIVSFALSSDGKLVAQSGANFTVRLWDVIEKKEKAVLSGHKHHALALEFSPDNQLLASGSLDRTVRVWNLATLKEHLLLQGYANPVTALAISPDGKTLVSGSLDGYLKVWDLGAGKEGLGQPGHLAGVNSLAISPNGKTLISGAADGTVRLWELATLKELFPTTGHRALVRHIAFSPDGKSLVSASGDKFIHLWDLANASQRLSFVSTPEPTPQLATQAVVFVPPDGQAVATANHDGSIRLFQAASGKEERILFQLPGLLPTDLAYARNGSALAAALSDFSIRLLDPATGKERALLKGHTARLHALAFSPDHQLLASGGADGKLRLWNVATGSERWVAPESIGAIAALAFSPDGKTVAAGGGDDRFVHLFDVAGQSVRGTLSGHANRITGLAYSPVENIIAASGLDGRIIVWNAESRNVIREWQLPGIVWNVAFAPDGRHLAVANSNGTIYILQVPPPAAK
jgi:WD40 repeat protein/tRNA A-37 threonylcarbamoyl transferase component Bud32